MRDAATPSGIPGKKLLLGLLAAFVVAVVPFIIVPTLIHRTQSIELPDLGTVPPFALTDDSGQTFTEEALRGHPTIVNFVFTRCDTVCPIISMKMQRLQDKLSDRRAESIKLLSISVDPAYDTPERLSTFAQRYKARPDKWRFLTGPVDKVRELVEGPFMNSMIVEGVQANGAPSVSHSGYFLLVDGDLEIRGVYNSSDMPRLDELMHHARYLARTSKSKGYKFGE